MAINAPLMQMLQNALSRSLRENSEPTFQAIDLPVYIQNKTHEKKEEEEEEDFDEEKFEETLKGRYRSILRNQGPNALKNPESIPSLKQLAREYYKREHCPPKYEDIKIDLSEGFERNLEKAMLKNNAKAVAEILQVAVERQRQSSISLPFLQCIFGCYDFNLRTINHRNIKDDIFRYLMNKEFPFDSFRLDSINLQDGFGYTLLAAAAEKNMSNVVKFLLDFQADTSLFTVTKDTPLLLSCCHEQPDVALMILERNADPKRINIYGESPLHKACQYSSSIVIEALLKAGADINVQNEKGQTPLHLSLIHQKEDNANLIITHGASIQNIDNHGNSTLFYAMGLGLCRQLADFENFDPTEEDWILLRGALLKGSVSQIKDLIEKGININFQGLDGRTPLLFFCCGKNDADDILELLVENGANLNICDEFGNTPLHCASYNGLAKSVNKLLEYGLSVNVKNANGTTSLMKAAKRNQEAVVDKLTEANVNMQDKHGNTALHFASSEGYESIVKLLLHRGANPEIENKRKQSAICQALMYRKTKVVELFQKNFGDSFEFEYALADELYKASVDDHPKCMEYFMELGADINGVFYDRSPLHNAYFAQSKEAVRCLIKAGADVNKVDPEGWVLLFGASQDNQLTYLAMLNELNADIHIQIQDDHGKNALHYACENKNIEIIDFLLKQDGGSQLCIADKYGDSPLHTAVKSGDCEVLRSLINSTHTIDVNVVDTNEQTALYLASRLGHLECVEIILQCDKSDVNAARYDGLTPLHVARSPAIVKLLLNKNANIMAKDYIGNSPYLNHCQRGRLECANLLADLGRDHINNMKRTALHLYAENFDTNDIENLLLCDDLNAVDINGQTALHLACSKGHSSTVQCLLTVGVDIDIIDKSGLKAFHIANDHIYSAFDEIEKDEVALRFLKYRKDTIPSNLDRMSKYFDHTNFNVWNETIKHPLGGFIEVIPEQLKEFDEIASSVRAFMNQVSVLVENQDPQMAFTVVQSGSVGENTKVKLPDEFDFLCVLDKLSQDVEIPNKFTFNPSCVELLSKKTWSFADDSGQLLSFGLIRRFYREFSKALANEQLWEQFPKFHRAVSDDITEIQDTISNLNLIWHGDVYVRQQISIDIVPTVQFPHWIPPWCDNHKNLVEQFGCFAVAKKIDYAPIEIQPRLFQLCFSTAEAHLMKLMPKEYLDGFKLAKLLKDVCLPAMQTIATMGKEQSRYADAVLFSSPQTGYLGNSNELHDLVVSRLSSYQLKSCLCQLFLENSQVKTKNVNMSKDGEIFSALKITSLIFQKLMESFHLKYLPSPFIRGYNVLNKISCYETVNRMLQLYCFLLQMISQRKKVTVENMKKAYVSIPFFRDCGSTRTVEKLFTALSGIISNPENFRGHMN